MKIGLVCPYNIARGGGVQEVVFAMQKELRKRGHDAWVITPQPGDLEPDPKEHIIFVGKSTDFNSPLHTTVQLSAADSEHIQEMLEEHQFDILHFHEPWVPMLSMQILSRSKSVNVATFHAKLPDSLVTRTISRVVTPYTKSVLKYIHEYTAVSDAAAEYVCSLTDQPVALVPNGINTERYKAPKTRNDDNPNKTIFYVGRLEQRKGVKYLISAFSLLLQQRPDVRLVVASDGPDRAKLEMLAADLGIADKVQFVGFISEDEKIEYMRSADLFCSPALYGESFGIVLLEAMASGLVTVAGNNPGYASVLQGAGAISLVNPKDSVEFARRLETLLYEKDLRKLWRTWAKEQIPQYKYDHIVSQYEEVYETAMHQHGHLVGAGRPADE